MGEALLFPNSDRLCEWVAEQTGGVTLLSFSTGKDSIGAWLHLRRYFKRIIPVYMYTVPGLEFVEESLRYYEDFFGCHIYRMPQPSLYNWFNNCFFTPPDRMPVAMSLNLEEFTRDHVFDIVKLHNGLALNGVYTAVGVRAVDSLNRWASIKTHGAVNRQRMNFFPIYDWRKDRLLEEIIRAGVKLPVDYRIWGRTFDGVDWRFLKPLKEYYPRDYARILDYFPLLEVELLRYEARQALQD